MKDRYYYLVAQLPYLLWGVKPSAGIEWFIGEAKKWLTEDELNILLKGDLSYSGSFLSECPALNQYKEFEHKLREALAFLRGASEFSPDPLILNKAKEAVAAENPLDAENRLLKLRWDYLEETEQGNYFNLEFLVVYFLKLKILLRIFSFEKEKGLEIFDKLTRIGQPHSEKN